VCALYKKNKQERYATIGPDVGSMREFILNEKKDGSRVNIVYEISGQAGFIYDSLIDCVDSITVANPDKMTWIYPSSLKLRRTGRTTKKNDRMDARKMAVLLRSGEIPAVYMPNKEVRQWRMVICHRKKLLEGLVCAKDRIRALLKSQGIARPTHKGSWWKVINRLWMRGLGQNGFDVNNMWKLQLNNLLDELEQKEKQIALVTE
jgi:transposase